MYLYICGEQEVEKAVGIEALLSKTIGEVLKDYIVYIINAMNADRPLHFNFGTGEGLDVFEIKGTIANLRQNPVIFADKSFGKLRFVREGKRWIARLEGEVELGGSRVKGCIYRVVVPDCYFSQLRGRAEELTKLAIARFAYQLLLEVAFRAITQTHVSLWEV